MLIALLSVLGPLGGGVVAWWAQSRIEQNRREAERLRSERAKIYLAVLEPFVNVFSNPKHQATPIEKVLTSKAFQDAAFQINLVGSDRVVKAVNAMFMFFYQTDMEDRSNLIDGLTMYGEMMLAIRRDLGNRKTKLEPFDMLRSRLKDLHTLEIEAAIQRNA